MIPRLHCASTRTPIKPYNTHWGVLLCLLTLSPLKISYYLILLILQGSCSEISCEFGFILVGSKCQALISEVNKAVLILNSIVCANTIAYPAHQLLEIYPSDTCDFIFPQVFFSFLTERWKKCQWCTKTIRVSYPQPVSIMIERMYEVHKPDREQREYGLHPMVHPNFTVYFNMPRFVNPIVRVEHRDEKFLANCLTPRVTYALAPWQVCPRVLVESSRFYLRTDDLSLCFKEYDACVDSKFARLSDDHMHFEICIGQFKQAIRNTYIETSAMVTGDYVFIIFLLVALVACLLHVISTVLLTENWTPVVISEISISAAYFIMLSIQAISRVFSLDEELCGILGMAGHLLHICAAGFPCIVCLDLTRSILMVVRFGITEYLKPIRFGYYVAINLAVCCTVIACNVLPNLEAEDSLVGYSSSSCQIFSSSMNIYTLGLPLGLSFLLQLICFTIVYMHIRGVPSYVNSPEVTSIKTLMMVAFLLWMCWILEYLSNTTAISIFRSLQTLTFTFTGLFLFIGFSPAFSDA